MFENVFGQSVEETLRDAGEEGVVASPSKKELENHNLDHAAFRGWCPHCVKCRTEAYGHRKR